MTNFSTHKSVVLKLISSTACVMAFVSCGSESKKLKAGDVAITNPQPVVKAGVTPTPPSPTPPGPAGLPTVESFQALAAQFGSRVSLPTFETTSATLDQSTVETLNRADSQVAKIIAIPKAERTFENTIRAIDDLLWEVSYLGNKLDLIKETSTDEAIRNRATERLIEVKQWSTTLTYREDLYQATVEFGETHPNLADSRGDLSLEDLKYYRDLQRDARQAGMNLPKDKRTQIEALFKQLDELSTTFQKNTNDDRTSVELTPAEMEGVPADALEQYKTNNGKYVIMARLPTHASPVLDNGKNEEARRKVITARYQVAMDKNVAIFEQALAIRQQIADLLGANSWADYRMENRMAKDFDKAQSFVVNVARGLKPKMNAEIAEMLQLKRRDTNNPAAKFEIWDYYYYMNQLQKERYAVDHEELKNYFPSDRVLAGMFEVYSKMFRVKFTEVEAPYKWIPDLKLYMVQDSQSLAPLGLIYFDLYPREGKYDHFAQFGILNGKRQPDGIYQRPVVAVVCNFPAPTSTTPSLLTFDDVETMFHEFGHAMHSVLTEANYNEYSGTSVQDDFVEAPSQMLENWVMQKEVTDLIAADWRDPSRKISQNDLDRIRAAKFSTLGIYFTRQMALALSDFRFHAKGETKNTTKILNETFSEVFLSLPDNTNFAASWGHLMGGYDSGYYSYAWAKVISSDLFTAFKANPKGFIDSGLGLRLRREIYSVGGSRDAADSVRAFLGRDYTMKPFFAEFGIQ